MKFSTREDISAPIEAVFAELSDFDAFERAILRRGAEVRRRDELTEAGPGMAWHSRFPFRGRPRDLTAELTRFEAPELIEIASKTSGLDGLMKLELVQLSPRQTRLALELDIRPQTISARLFLQSLRLAKSGLTRRFKNGVHRYAKDMEDRLNGRA